MKETPHKKAKGGIIIMRRNPQEKLNEMKSG